MLHVVEPRYKGASIRTVPNAYKSDPRRAFFDDDEVFTAREPAP